MWCLMRGQKEVLCISGEITRKYSTEVWYCMRKLTVREICEGDAEYSWGQWDRWNYSGLSLSSFLCPFSCSVDTPAAKKRTCAQWQRRWHCELQWEWRALKKLLESICSGWKIKWKSGRGQNVCAWITGRAAVALVKEVRGRVLKAADVWKRGEKEPRHGGAEGEECQQWFMTDGYTSKRENKGLQDGSETSFRMLDGLDEMGVKWKGRRLKHVSQGHIQVTGVVPKEDEKVT